MQSPVVLLVLDGALAALGVQFADEGRMVPALSIFATLAVLGVWQLVLFMVAPQPAVKYKVELLFRGTHYIQALLQATIYVYLALYWDAIRINAPLILAQAVIGCLCDILLSWSRGRAARVSFGIMPVILSTNLFLWFREDYFYYQIMMVALAFFSKEFLTWTYDGRRRHIFNPSAFPLTVASLLLMATGSVKLTSGVDMVIAFESAPNFYEVVFLLGLVTQALYQTTTTSLGAVIALYGLHYASGWICGGPVSDNVHPQVFLGLTFLVTDPATSPKSNVGKLLFGASYGLGVFASFILLRLAHQPSYFDKLLVVPVVNLMVPLFDRLSELIETVAPSVLVRVPTRLSRVGWLAAYMALFTLILPDIKSLPTEPITLLPQSPYYLSDDMRRLVKNYFSCRSIYPRAYQPFGLPYELFHVRELRQIYHLAGKCRPTRHYSNGRNRSSTLDRLEATCETGSPVVEPGATLCNPPGESSCRSAAVTCSVTMPSTV
ncbi:MAG TPA: RnfABCDGE type electron transport complex subunit D [Planctomycetaceae bacterium]|jgi:hypothetical protein